MRSFVRLLLPAWLVLTMGERVRAQDTVRAVIDKAIQAAGGAEKLGAFKAVRVKFDYTAYLGSTASS